MAKDYFKGLGSASKKITKAQNKYADFAGEVAKLPYQLTDEYRKAQDPALNASINKSEQNMFSAPITALETYKDISDPTTRRALAEKAAGTATVDYKNLTDERTRREGVYSDYVAKWTGLYGAEAAKEQAKVNSQVDSWNRDMNLAGQKQAQANRIEDNAESRRRWEYEQAHKGGSGTSKTENFLADAVSTLQGSVGTDGKVDPRVYEQVRSLAAVKGIDASKFDSNFGSLLSSSEQGNVGIKTAKEKSANEQMAALKLKNAQSIEDIKSKANNNQEGYYWSGGTLKKKKAGLFGIDWLASDETIK